MHRTCALLLPAAVLLSACDSGSAPEAAPTQGSDAPGAVASATPAPMPSMVSPVGDPEATGDLPAAMHGRWGLVAADCEPGRADAKGLLVIGPRRLEFYESVGTLDSVEQADGNRVRASFDFTGEGMTWERGMEIELHDGGQALVRSEFGPDAAPEPLRYARCS